MKRILALKEEALDALHGNFGKAALATLGMAIISAAISYSIKLIGGMDIMDYIDAVSEGDFAGMMESIGGNAYASLLQLLISILFTVPFTVGAINTFRMLVQSKGSDNKLFANFFKIGFGRHYLHVVLVSFVSGLLIGLIIAPVVLILILVIIMFHNIAVTLILALVTLVYAIWIGLMYSQISFIVIDNPELDILDTMRRSRNLMDGSKWRFFVLEISFIGWIFLGIFTLAIGYLWLLPYVYSTEAAFYCDLRDAEKVEQA